MCIICQKDDLTKLVKVAIRDCYEIKNIPGLPPNVKELHIDNCPKITNIQIPSYIREFKIADCVGITTINLEKGIKTLSIANCCQLENVQIPETVIHINIVDCGKMYKILNYAKNVEFLRLDPTIKNLVK